jgi:hypothetical protein
MCQACGEDVGNIVEQSGVVWELKQRVQQLEKALLSIRRTKITRDKHFEDCNCVHCIADKALEGK